MSKRGEFTDRRLELYTQYQDAEREAIAEYEADPLSFQQAALAEAQASNVEIKIPLSGVFDVVKNVDVIRVPEPEVELSVPEGCVSKEQLIKISRELGITSRSAAVTWGSIFRRAIHNIKISPEGLTETQKQRISELQERGIRIYQYIHEGETETQLYFYTFKDKSGEDVELFCAHEGIEVDSPYDAENERFLMADAFVKAVDEGWLDTVEDEEIDYWESNHFGEKTRSVLEYWAKRLREGSIDIEPEDLALGYATFDEVAEYAEKNGIRPNHARKIERMLTNMGKDGKITPAYFESGYVRPYYTDDDLFPTHLSDVPSVELITEDGLLNLDTFRFLCCRGIMKGRGLTAETIVGKLAWGFLEAKRKEAFEALQQTNQTEAL